ncbi:MAG: diguanylate cyclase [Sideroxydans sp.]|nr:diguanylate cyclase [Sideroxydans sp.]
MKQIRILFVGLDDSVVESVSSALEAGQRKLTCLSVVDATSMDEVLLNQRLDVLLVSDVGSGVLVKESIAALHRNGKDIPCIVLLAGQSTMSLSQAIEYGAHDCLGMSDVDRIYQTIVRESGAAALRHNVREQIITDFLLQEIDHYILNSYALGTIAEKICQRLAELFEFKLTCIGMKKNGGEVEVVAAAGEVNRLMGMKLRWDDKEEGNQAIGLAIRENRSIVLGELDSPPAHAQRNDSAVCKTMAIPLGIESDVIGALMMCSDNESDFDELAVRRLTAFAARVTVALLSAQETQELRLMEAAMSNAANAMFITDRDGFIIWMNKELIRFSGYDFDEVIGKHASLFSKEQGQDGYWPEAWKVVEAGKPWRGDVVNTHKSGTLYTVMQSISPLFDQHHEITNFLVVQQDISDRQRLEEEIHYLAYHDMLTNLPNRMLFQDRVQQEIVHSKRNKAKFAVVFIDLDGFKEVNDTRGHAGGDKLLQTIAKRLRACLREGDTVARLGGDEFTILLTGMEQGEGLERVLNKIINSVAQPCPLGEFTASVTASIGVSLYPADATGVEKLLLHADAAMYQAKQAGKNRFVLYGNLLGQS